MGGAPRHDVVAEHADALDLRLDVVAGLQVELERVGLDRGHTRDRAGGEDVAGRVALRRVVRDEVRDRDEHLGGVAALADAAVDPQFHRQRLGVGHLVLGHDPGADRAEGVDRLGEGEHAGLHLPALDVAGRNVVEDRVPGDVVPGLLRPEELAAAADDDGELELVVKLLGRPLGIDDGVIRADDRVDVWKNTMPCVAGCDQSTACSCW